mgnify:CR=1 FL=1
MSGRCSAFRSGKTGFVGPGRIAGAVVSQRSRVERGGVPCVWDPPECRMFGAVMEALPGGMLGGGVGRFGKFDPDFVDPAFLDGLYRKGDAV